MARASHHPKGADGEGALAGKVFEEKVADPFSVSAGEAEQRSPWIAHFWRAWRGAVTQTILMDARDARHAARETHLGGIGGAGDTQPLCGAQLGEHRRPTDRPGPLAQPWFARYEGGALGIVLRGNALLLGVPQLASDSDG